MRVLLHGILAELRILLGMQAQWLNKLEIMAYPLSGDTNRHYWVNQAGCRVMLAACLICLTSPAPATAQSGAIKAAFEALATCITDSTTISACSTNVKVMDHGTTPASLALVRGLSRLYVGAGSGQRDDLDAAQAAFDEAIYRAPDNWPWAWYGLALTDLALERGGYTVKASMHQAAGVHYHDAAIHALNRAVMADSSFEPAVELLADQLAPGVDGSVNGETQAAIRRAVQAGTSDDAEAWLVFGRLQRNLAHPDSALAAFERYLAQSGDSAVAFLEQARALYTLNDTVRAYHLYLQGAMGARSIKARAEYRRDIRWVASPEEISAFDSLPVDSIGPWIGRFWKKRNAAALRPPGQRVIEHLRRWDYVFAHFRLPPPAQGLARSGRLLLSDSTDLPGNIMPNAIGAPQAAPDPTLPPINPADLYANSRLNTATRGVEFVDDRALIYMRFGEPDNTGMAVARVGGIPETLSWQYNTTNGPLLFHFACESYCVLGLFPRSLDGLGSLDGRYEILASQLRMGHPSTILLDHIRTSIAHDLLLGLTTDGFPPHFKHQLSPQAQFYAVGSPGRVLVVFALPGDKLEGQSLPDGGTGYPVTLRLIATNARGQVARSDTTRRFRSAHALSQGEYLFGLEELQLVPGTWDVRLLVSEAGTDAGGAIGRIGVTVPATSGFALSDLILGREGSGLHWQGPAGAIPLNPLDAYPHEGAAELYYELSGATAGTAYQTDIEVTGVYGDAKGTVHLTFNEQAGTALIRSRRSIELGQLEPGQYRITVTVTESGTGRTAVQTRLLNVSP